MTVIRHLKFPTLVLLLAGLALITPAQAQNADDIPAQAQNADDTPTKVKNTKYTPTPVKDTKDWYISGAFGTAHHIIAGEGIKELTLQFAIGNVSAAIGHHFGDNLRVELEVSHNKSDIKINAEDDDDHHYGDNLRNAEDDDDHHYGDNLRNAKDDDNHHHGDNLRNAKDDDFLSDSQMTNIAVMLNGAYDFNAGGWFRPYIMLGGGINQIVWDNTSAKNTEFAYQLGTGINFEMSDSASLFVGYSYRNIPAKVRKRDFISHGVQVGLRIGI